MMEKQLREYYERMIVPETLTDGHWASFENLSDQQKKVLADSLGFAKFRLSQALSAFGDLIVDRVKP